MRKTKAPTCESFAGSVGDYLKGDLTRDIEITLNHHLSGCEDCAAFLKTYRKTIELTREVLKIRGFKNHIDFALQASSGTPAIH